MKSGASVGKPDGKSDTTGLISKVMPRVGIYIMVLVALLFISSGRLDWVMAWVYIGVHVVIVGLGSLLLIRKSPDLVAERLHIKEDAKKWDRVVVILMAGVLPPVTLLVAGWDARFGWSPQVPLVLQIAASALLVLGHLLVLWAMLVNNFFSAVLRIQTDRGHTVVTVGPYQYVRHPGYVGAIVFSLATPMMLGSVWACIPAALMLSVTVVRTAFEDRTLHGELDGYEDYARRVRYRLLPGLW